jgi:hypothetical protein
VIVTAPVAIPRASQTTDSPDGVVIVIAPVAILRSRRISALGDTIDAGPQEHDSLLS